LCAIGGRIVLAALQGSSSQMVSDKIVRKELKIIGSYGVSSTQYREALAWIERDYENIWSRIPCNEITSLSNLAEFFSSSEPKPLFNAFAPQRKMNNIQIKSLL
jgi:threonine dehydrogenase-like Zn-dependent dehydrogenase